MGKKGGGGPGDRKSSSAKAGKRHGTITYPAPISSERFAAKEQGEQQFVAKKQLTAQREVNVLVWDKALRGVVMRPRNVTVSADYAWDADRGRIVSSPKFKEAK